jgi:hypothetical protein
MLKSMLLPSLIQPYAPACPAGAEALVKIAQDPNLQPIAENAYDLLEQFSAEPLVGYALLLAPSATGTNLPARRRFPALSISPGERDLVPDQCFVRRRSADGGLRSVA